MNIRHPFPSNNVWNLACFQAKRAELHFRNKRFDEAMQCHDNVALLLLNVIENAMMNPKMLEVALAQYHDAILQKYLVRCQKQISVIKKSEEQDSKTKKICAAIYPRDMYKLLQAIRGFCKESMSLFKLVIEKLNSNNMGGIDDHDADITKAPTRKIVTVLHNRNRILIAIVRQFLSTAEPFVLDNSILRDRIDYLKLLDDKVIPQAEQEQ